MQSGDLSLNISGRQFAGWLVLGPVLALWPFLSVLPIFSLLTGGAPLTLTLLNVALLATGFWAFLGLVITARRLLTRAGRMGFAEGLRRSGLILGSYALVWTTAYFAVAYLYR